MNPLQHFGIKSRMIRSDTKSYNLRKLKVSAYDENSRERHLAEAYNHALDNGEPEQAGTFLNELEDYDAPHYK